MTFPAPDPATAAALARLYDLDVLDDPGDTDLYLALADRAGEEAPDPNGSARVLELMVGTGRIAVPIAAAGHRVTGVDRDPAMLERARRRAASEDVELELVEADVVELRLASGTGFDLGFIALNSLMTLPSRADQAAAVRALADHLVPGGIAAIDVWLPDAEDLARYDGRVILEWPRHDPETGHVVTKTGSAQYDAATGTILLTSLFEAGPQGEPPARWVRHERLRLVSADELSGFAESAGLRVEQVAGGYDLEPLGPGSGRAVLIATRP